MLICTICGTENPDGFRFCGGCGAAVAVVPPRESRKTVTVLFCDVTGSTALGERLDPESLRRVMGRYFDAMRIVIERHGGTVEKFIGDAVMAVFGIPQVHEDDAVRALRAAFEMRSALAELNVALEHDYGVSLELRTGVNTGEVVTGTAERLATGDAVNVAARLEQACPPGDVLVSADTLRLTRHGVTAEAVEPLQLKGKSEPVAAFRLIAVQADAAPAPRGSGAAMVGRERQRRLLADTWEHCAGDRACSLFTVLGAAGVGKSRLVEEFLAQTGAAVARGRCLSYGEGITYWPVVQVVKQVLGDDASSRLAELVTDGAAADAVRVVLGDIVRPVTGQEIAWGVRRLLQAAAEEAPLIVVFDDIHWGEPTFLDLIEHVADWAGDAPLLILCMARPDLLETRPTWGGGKLNATIISLDPLTGDETNELIDRLLGDEGIVEEGLRERIAASAGGNPLYVEEMLALVQDAGSGHIVVPPTIQALLAARLDQLGPSERTVLERGSVEGLSFHGGAVAALAPEEPDVRGSLLRLTRTELVRPDTAILPGEDAFRFRHLLIRDAAYDALPKAVRAELHERFATWLDERAPDLVERDEIVGYHLEEAYRHRIELGPPDERAIALAAAARERVRAAGGRALERGDFGAACALLTRASALLPPDVLDVTLELRLADSLFVKGEPAAALARAEGTAERAAARGDRIGELHARLVRARLVGQTDPDRMVEQLEGAISEALPLFEEAKYHAGLADAWRAVLTARHVQCRFDDGALAATKAMEYAELAGDRQAVRLMLPQLGSQSAMGTMRLEQFLPWLDAVVEKYGYDPWFDQWRSLALAMLGRVDEARTLNEQVVAAVEERGISMAVAIAAMGRWVVEMLAGDFEAAERIARRGCELLEEMGEVSWLSTLTVELAETLYQLERDDEAQEWAERGLALGGDDDVITQATARQVLGKLAARRGAHKRARELATTAVRIMADTQAPTMQADAHLDLAQVLVLAGDREGARAELERAAELYAAKGASLQHAAVASRLADVEQGLPAHD